MLITDMCMAQGSEFSSVILIWSPGQDGPLSHLKLSQPFLTKPNCILRAICNLQIISLIDSKQ